MIGHASVTVADPEEAAPFRDAATAALGHPRTCRTERGIGCGARNGPACHAAFVLDPDGNRIGAVNHAGEGA